MATLYSKRGKNFKTTTCERCDKPMNGVTHDKTSRLCLSCRKREETPPRDVRKMGICSGCKITNPEVDCKGMCVQCNGKVEWETLVRAHLLKSPEIFSYHDFSSKVNDDIDSSNVDEEGDKICCKCSQKRPNFCLRSCNHWVHSSCWEESEGHFFRCPTCESVNLKKEMLYAYCDNTVIATGTDVEINHHCSSLLPHLPSLGPHFRPKRRLMK